MKVKVKALKLGFIGRLKKRPGDVFEIEEKLVSKRWMKRLDEITEVKGAQSEPSEAKPKGKKVGKDAAPKSTGDAEVI